MRYKVDADLFVEAESVEEAMNKVESLITKSKTARQKGIEWSGGIAYQPLPAVIDLPIIPAEAQSDDYVMAVKFDAVDWFKQVPVWDIVELAGIDWGGDYAADKVVDFFVENGHVDLTLLMDYIYNRTKVVLGFECHVDRIAALDWLQKNRPEVILALEEQGLMEEE